MGLFQSKPVAICSRCGATVKKSGYIRKDGSDCVICRMDGHNFVELRK